MVLERPSPEEYKLLPELSLKQLQRLNKMKVLNQVKPQIEVAGQLASFPLIGEQNLADAALKEAVELSRHLLHPKEEPTKHLLFVIGGTGVGKNRITSSLLPFFQSMSEPVGQVVRDLEYDLSVLRLFRGKDGLINEGRPLGPDELTRANALFSQLISSAMTNNSLVIANIPGGTSYLTQAEDWNGEKYYYELHNRKIFPDPLLREVAGRIGSFANFSPEEIHLMVAVITASPYRLLAPWIRKYFKDPEISFRNARKKAKIFGVPDFNEKKLASFRHALGGGSGAQTMSALEAQMETTLAFFGGIPRLIPPSEITEKDFEIVAQMWNVEPETIRKIWLLTDLGSTLITDNNIRKVTAGLNPARTKEPDIVFLGLNNIRYPIDDKEDAARVFQSMAKDEFGTMRRLEGRVNKLPWVDVNYPLVDSSTVSL